MHHENTDGFIRLQLLVSPTTACHRPWYDVRGP